jgi:hypothetical protein
MLLLLTSVYLRLWILAQILPVRLAMLLTAGLLMLPTSPQLLLMILVTLALFRRYELLTLLFTL